MLTQEPLRVRLFFPNQVDLRSFINYATCTLSPSLIRGRNPFGPIPLFHFRKPISPLPPLRMEGRCPRTLIHLVINGGLAVTVGQLNCSLKYSSESFTKCSRVNKWVNIPNHSVRVATTADNCCLTQLPKFPSATHHHQLCPRSFLRLLLS